VPKRPADDDVVNVAIRFPIGLHEQAKQRAANEDLTLSQLVRRVLRGYLDTESSETTLTGSPT